MEKKLYVVGMGPGGHDDMTFRADRALRRSEVIAGYTVYVDLIRSEYPQAEIITTPMRKEKERCELALRAAAAGKITSMICSGDSGVYGMASLILEMAGSYPDVSVEIIPGITAALSGGALLGAPLGHDFAVISMSDALTPMETIEKRLAAAAQSDMIICLYNPESRKRKGYLRHACEIISRYRSPDTVCGTASEIGRDGEKARILTLGELSGTPVDMFTTVFIGSSSTKNLQGRMVTPRGYRGLDAAAEEDRKG